MSYIKRSILHLTLISDVRKTYEEAKIWNTQMCLECAAFTRTCLSKPVLFNAAAFTRKQSGFIYISSSFGLQCSPCQQQASIAVVLMVWWESLSQHILLTLFFTSVWAGGGFVINYKARFQICVHISSEAAWPSWAHTLFCTDGADGVPVSPWAIQPISVPACFTVSHHFLPLHSPQTSEQCS